MRKPVSLAFLAACLAANSSAESSFLTKPDIHGDQIVFTAEGDLWLGSIAQKTAQRITSDPGAETDAHFSPDGLRIAFTAGYDGGRDVYMMPTSGGPPRRMTFDPIAAEVLGWTPDGKSILFRSRRNSGTPNEKRIYSVSYTGGMPTLLPVPRGEFGSLAPNGMLAYVPVSFEWANWFHYQGGSADKIWLADLTHKTFKKLTEGATVDTTPVWCGKKIYFVSERTGFSNIWEMDPSGGELKQCTFYNDAPVRYPSSDGKTVIFQHGAHLATFTPASRQVSELTFAYQSDRIHERDQRSPLAAEVGPVTFYSNGGGIGRFGNGVSIGPSGKRILLEARGQIVSMAAEAGDLRVLENTPGTRARMPAWAPDGKSFAFLSDRSGENEIWIGNASGGAEPKQLTHGLAANPHPFHYSPDGKWIGIQDRNGRTMIIEVATGTIKVIDQSDNAGSYDANPGTMAFSADSKLVAFSRQDSNWVYGIKLYELGSGKTATVSDWRVNSYAPSFDPTGKFLVYLTDDNFEPSFSNVTGKYYIDKATRVRMAPLTSDAKSPFLPKDDEEGVDEEGKAKTPPAPAPAVSVDWANLGKRVIAVPAPAGRYAYVDSFPGHLLLIDYNENPNAEGGVEGGGTLFSFDFATRAMSPIAGGVEMFQKSFDGKKILLGSGRQLSVHDLTGAPTTMAAGALNLAPYTVEYKPKDEWKEVFEESWRVARDFYYDPKMNGLDWNAIKSKYEARLSLVGDRGDLSKLLQDLVSELRTGHSYVGYSAPGARRNNIGYLGADLEVVPLLDNQTVTSRHGSDLYGIPPVDFPRALKITKLYQGDSWDAATVSPLLEPGLDVKEGDYIVRIAGQDISSYKDVNELMLGTQGQTVAIMVNTTPYLKGARTIRIRPLASEIPLRYQDWVMSRTRYVEEHGGPNFGYAHMSDMGAPGLVGFQKGQTGDPFKTAMVYDTRFNGGGFTSSLILQDIASYPTAWFKPRHGQPWTRESWSVIGHKVALCNEFNFSDGELFIEAWKRMGLGPVVGMRTGGGEVGSGNGYELIDHGTVFIPNYGAYREGEWLIEGKGASPTVSVEQDPAAVMAGRDPQLDRAIELLKKELEKTPVSIPQHPPFKDAVIPKHG